MTEQVERLLVCGGRDFENWKWLFGVLNEYDIASMCHGGAKGADSMAGVYAVIKRIPCQVFYADWERYGKRAGPIRNRQMLTVFQPTLVIAFPGGRGTANMVGLSRGASVPVRVERSVWSYERKGDGGIDDEGISVI